MIIRFFLYFFVSFILLKTAAGNDYKVEMFFTNQFKSLSFPNDYKFIDIDGKAVWKDSNGDYGNLQCYGRIVEDKKVGSNLDLFCKAKNQKSENFWFRMQRNSKEMDAGVGITTYLYGDGKYKKFVDRKCKYASKIFDNNAIVNQKCSF